MNANTIPIAYELFELKPIDAPTLGFPVCYEAMVMTPQHQDILPNFRIITELGTWAYKAQQPLYPSEDSGWISAKVPGEKLTPEAVKETIEDWLGTAYQVTVVDANCPGYM